MKIFVIMILKIKKIYTNKNVALFKLFPYHFIPTISWKVHRNTTFPLLYLVLFYLVLFYFVFRNPDRRSCCFVVKSHESHEIINRTRMELNRFATERTKREKICAKLKFIHFNVLWVGCLFSFFILFLHNFLWIFLKSLVIFYPSFPFNKSPLFTFFYLLSEWWDFSIFSLVYYEIVYIGALQTVNI